MESDLLSRLTAGYLHEIESRSLANDNLETLASKYDGNFDILEDDDAIDTFLHMIVDTYDSSTIMMLPEQFKDLPDAGSVCRYEGDQFVVGVDSNYELRGDIEPIFDPIPSFMNDVNIIMKKRSTRPLEVPPMSFVLSPVTRRTSKDQNIVMDHISKLGHVVVDPPNRFKSHLQAIGMVTYESPLTPDQIDRVSKSGKMVLGFNLENLDLENYKNLRVKAGTFNFSPYQPVSSKYINTVNREKPGLVTGTYYMNRRVRKFKCELSEFNVYPPIEWAAYLRLPVSKLPLEMMALELVTNSPIDIPVRIPKSIFFPYVVEAYNFDPTGKSKIEVIKNQALPTGRYKSMDLNSELNILRGVFQFVKLEMVKLTPLSSRSSKVTVLTHRGEVEFFTMLGWPRHPDFFMLCGNYYMRYYNDVDYGGLKKGKIIEYAYQADIMVATSLSNVYTSYANSFMSISIFSMTKYYNDKQHLAYFQHYMTMAQEYVDTDQYHSSGDYIEVDLAKDFLQF